MKKYMSPATVVVELHTRKVVMQVTSMDIWEEEEEINNPDEILSKGVINNRNIWDEEW